MARMCVGDPKLWVRATAPYLTSQEGPGPCFTAIDFIKESNTLGCSVVHSMGGFLIGVSIRSWVLVLHSRCGAAMERVMPGQESTRTPAELEAHVHKGATKNVRSS